MIIQSYSPPSLPLKNSSRYSSFLLCQKLIRFDTINSFLNQMREYFILNYYFYYKFNGFFKPSFQSLQIRRTNHISHVAQQCHTKDVKPTGKKRYYIENNMTVSTTSLISLKFIGFIKLCWEVKAINKKVEKLACPHAQLIAAFKKNL